MESINNLPNDLQREIYNLTLSLRKPKQVLTAQLKNDIETYHLLNDLLTYYHVMFSDKMNSCNYYLDWLENDILCELNDNIPMIMGFTEELMKAFPGLTPDQIMFEINDEKHSVHGQLQVIKKYWKHLSPEKRRSLYYFTTRTSAK